MNKNNICLRQHERLLKSTFSYRSWRVNFDHTG